MGTPWGSSPEGLKDPWGFQRAAPTGLRPDRQTWQSHDNLAHARRPSSWVGIFSLFWALLCSVSLSFVFGKARWILSPLLKNGSLTHFVTCLWCLRPWRGPAALDRSSQEAWVLRLRVGGARKFLQRFKLHFRVWFAACTTYLWLRTEK